MSLHALAGHMAAKGRGPDSMLVHMTPDEVQSLQTMARAQGGDVTINPETGLPEAGFLSDTLKALAPVALGAVLGPAGFGLSATMAGVATGGITALATGSLSRGLMAGMGAYGGAGLGESLMGAGTGAMAAGDIAAQQAAGTFPELAAGATQEQVAKYAADVGALRDTALSKAGEAGLGAKMSSGLGQMASNPGAYAGDVLKYGLTAISPMMADKGVQTTTQRPDTGSIRRFSYDPYGQSYTPAGTFSAAEYKGMATGGIVALADGGNIAPGSEQYLQNVQNWFSQNPNATAEDVGNAVSTYNLNPADVANAMRSAGIANPAAMAALEAPPVAPAAGSDQYVQNVKNWFDSNPTATYQDIQGAIGQYGLDPEQVRQAMQSAGLSGAAQYAAFHPEIGAASNVEETYGGLKGLSSNINYWLAQNPGASMNDFNAEMDKWSLNNDDILRATGKTPAELLTGSVTKVFNPAPGAGGASGAGAVGGGAVVNPNGTVTTSPNIPGIPAGGFTGMQNVKDVYTQGGGSLGYVNPAPKTMEEFNQRFNRQTGDSRAAYDYLMGKGAYPTKSGVGEIMRPYSEATLGIQPAEGRPTQKYIYDAATRAYKENPNYVPVSYNDKGEKITGLSSTEVLKGFQALPNPEDDVATFDWMTANNVTVAQLATALGIPFAEAQARFNAAKAKKSAATPAAAGSIPYETYGDGSASAAASVGAVGAADAPGSDGTPGSGAKDGGLMQRMALGGLGSLAAGGQAQYNLGSYSDGGRLLRGPGDGVSDSIPATIGNKQPARLADGEFVVPARIVSELGNGSTEAGARKLYAMMDRVQKARGKTTGKNRVAANTRSDKYLPA